MCCVRARLCVCVCRPIHGGVSSFSVDPAMKDNVLFYEYLVWSLQCVRLRALSLRSP